MGLSGGGATHARRQDVGRGSRHDSHALGVLDPKGVPTARLEAVKKYDMARITYDDYLADQVKMVRVCNRCHALNFAGAELQKGEQMIRHSDLLLSEAIHIVADLYTRGLLKKPKT
jgi:hydroxylamine dehydrogenase